MNMSNCFHGSVAALGMKKGEAEFMNIQYVEVSGHNLENFSLEVSV
jgi:hypothetical protein